MHIPRIWFVLILIAGCLSHEAQAVFTPTTYFARKTTQAPTIDGDLSDDVWNDAQRINQFYVYKSGGTPAASTGEMKILWDDQNLYLSMAMDDDNILPSTYTAGEGGFDGPLWKGDVIEFFVHEKNTSPKYFEFEWSPNGDEFDARFDSQRYGAPSTNWNSGMSSAVTVDGTISSPGDTDTAYHAEAAIPLDSFDPIAEGSSWFFSFARYNFTPNGTGGYRQDLMMTTPGDPTAPNGGVTYGFHTYEIYDRLEFTGVVPEPGTGTIGLVMILLGMAVRRRRLG